MKAYTARAGRHDFKPREWPAVWRTKKIKKLRWQVVFAADCRYVLPDGDQWDWNKGGGISFNLLRNNRDNIMWAWRYNPDKDLIELTAYSNIKGGRYIGSGSGDVLMEIPLEKKVIIDIIPTIDNQWIVHFERQGMYQMHTYHPARKSFCLGKRLGLWFGGNRKAPVGMTVLIKFERTK